MFARITLRATGQQAISSQKFSSVKRTNVESRTARMTNIEWVLPVSKGVSPKPSPAVVMPTRVKDPSDSGRSARISPSSTTQ